MRREDILLKEYEILHEDTNEAKSRFWTFAGIVVGFNTVFLGGMGYFIISSFINMYGAQQIIILVGIVVLGSSIIAMLGFLYKLYRSINNVGHINYERAREIEAELGMRKNWMYFALFHFDAEKKDFDTGVNTEIKDALYRYHTKQYWEWAKKWYSTPKGDKWIRNIFFILITLWFLMIVMAFVVLVIN